MASGIRSTQFSSAGVGQKAPTTESLQQDPEMRVIFGRLSKWSAELILDGTDEPHLATEQTIALMERWQRAGGTEPQLRTLWTNPDCGGGRVYRRRLQDETAGRLWFARCWDRAERRLRQVLFVAYDKVTHPHRDGVRELGWHPLDYNTLAAVIDCAITLHTVTPGLAERDLALMLGSKTSCRRSLMRLQGRQVIELLQRGRRGRASRYRLHVRRLTEVFRITDEEAEASPEDVTRFGPFSSFLRENAQGLKALNGPKPAGLIPDVFLGKGKLWRQYLDLAERHWTKAETRGQAALCRQLVDLGLAASERRGRYGRVTHWFSRTGLSVEAAAIGRGHLGEGQSKADKRALKIQLERDRYRARFNIPGKESS
jgi:hypothetical protein